MESINVNNTQIPEFTKRKRTPEERKSARRGYWSRHWALYVMLILPMTFFAVFSYWPMQNILIAFTINNPLQDIWQIIGNGGWVGMDNFVRAFQTPQFLNAVRNTIMFSLLDLAVGFPAPIILAILINELKMEKFKKFTQTVSYMPHFLSWVIVGVMALQLFSQSSGAIPAMLYRWFGVNIDFLTNHTNWIITNVLFAVWRSIGWNTIIYLAAITSISPELYEAADIDGASRVRKMWHITLPGIRPVIITLFILALGGIMNADLARFESMGNSLVRPVADVIPMFIFRWALQGNQHAMGTAIGIIQSLFGLFLILGGNFLIKKLGGNGIW